MPRQTQLRTDDPGRIGRYLVAGRIAGIPSDDPIYLGTGPDGTEVTISMLTGNWARDAAARDRFAAEAAVAKRVPPFCAARVLDAGIDTDSAYLISDYVPGQSLLEIVSAGRLLTGAELEAIAIGMATGLASVHQAGLVHGHFGPEYVILPPDGPLRVVEFAITPPYGPATPSADMFAWAQTVYFATAGKPPAAVADLRLLPAQLREVAETCLDRDPLQRPAARAVVQALLGDATPSAGVLAEGSRRAFPGATGRLPYDGGPATRPGDGRPQSRNAPDAARRSSAASSGAGPAAWAQDPVPGSGTGRSPRLAARRPPASQRRTAGAPPETPRQAEAQRAHLGEHDRRADGRTAQQGSPSQRTHAHHQTRPRSRVAGILVGVFVVAAVLIGAVLLHVMQNSGSPHSGRKSAGAPDLRSSPVASTTSPTLTPAAFAGSWQGRATQPPNDTYTVSVILTTGAAGGSVSYSGTAHCSGTLSLTRATKSQLVMTQSITSGSCAKGTVTMTLAGGRTARFSFNGGGAVQATGTLTRH